MTRKERVELVLELFEQGLKNIAEELREILENAKEPCKHEPIVCVELKNVGTWFRQNMTHYRADPSMITCKHCGIRIRAEKWVDG